MAKTNNYETENARQIKILPNLPNLMDRRIEIFPNLTNVPNLVLDNLMKENERVSFYKHEIVLYNSNLILN